MKTRRGSEINLYFLLAITVCTALFQGTALAQDEAAPKIASNSTRTVSAGPDTSTPATSNSRESADIELLKTQLAQQQKHIEQLEHMLNEQKQMLEQVLLPATGNANDAHRINDTAATQPERLR